MSDYLTLFPLPTPEGPRHLKLDLCLVTALEAEGSLLKTAESLAAREMKLGDIIRLLQRIYGAADIAIADEYLLRQSPALLLAEVLLAILSPMTEMGAVQSTGINAVQGTRINEVQDNAFAGKPLPGHPG